MKKVLFYIFLISSYGTAYGQFPLTFDQGPPPYGSQWQGDTSFFSANNGLLQLNDRNPTSANDRYLSLLAPTTYDSVTTYELTSTLSFSPSGSNYAEWFLRTDQPDLTGPLNGYVVRIGGISGNRDALELFRQDGSGRTLLIAGTEGAVASAPVRVRVRVIQQPDGIWQLFADYNDSGTFILEGSVVDDTYPTGLFTGIRCSYTATRNEAFAFDDWQVKPLLADNTPPDLLSVHAPDAESLLLVFNEPIRQGGSSDLSTFSLTPSIPIGSRSFPAPNTVLLKLSLPLQNNSEYEITADQITDLAGNVSSTLSQSFRYLVGFEPDRGALLLSEFFANPSTDLAGLPPVEYIELFNTSQKFLALDSVAVQSGGAPVVLPDFLLPPGEHLVLVEEGEGSGFPGELPILEVNGLPGLSNGGDELILTTLNGAIIDQLTYQPSWYNTTASLSGLASLERIRFDLPADCPGNWSGSTAGAGGTPGLENSVHGTPLETVAPSLLTVQPLNEFEIALRFSEMVDDQIALDPTIYQLTPGIAVESVMRTGEGYLLILDRALEAGQIYTLQITEMADCLGNTLTQPLRLHLGLPEQPEPGDILVNEILFFPRVGGSDFVELVNASAKIIALDGLALRNTARESGKTQTVLSTGSLLFPGEYVALSENPEDIISQYPLPDSVDILENDLPAFDADRGNATLLHGTTILDAFDYREEQHSALLENARGVSLERLSIDLPTQQDGNWHSAAEAAGFATPGYQNSQLTEVAPGNGAVFQIPERTFSPNGDGVADILHLEYQTEQAGYLANIRIFNAEGVPVRQLTRNEFLATQGRILWDGSLDSGEPARTGIYIVWIELFLPEGDRIIIKDYCVLARALD